MRGAEVAASTGPTVSMLWPDSSSGWICQHTPAPCPSLKYTLTTHRPSYTRKNCPFSELSTHLLSACCVPGSVPSSGSSSENNADPVAALGVPVAQLQCLLPHCCYIRQVAPRRPEHCLPTHSTERLPEPCSYSLRTPLSGTGKGHCRGRDGRKGNGKGKEKKRREKKRRKGKERKEKRKEKRRSQGSEKEHVEGNWALVLDER